MEITLGIPIHQTDLLVLLWPHPSALYFPSLANSRVGNYDSYVLYASYHVPRLLEGFLHTDGVDGPGKPCTIPLRGEHSSKISLRFGRKLITTFVLGIVGILSLQHTSFILIKSKTGF